MPLPLTNVMCSLFVLCSLAPMCSLVDLMCSLAPICSLVDSMCSLDSHVFSASISCVPHLASMCSPSPMCSPALNFFIGHAGKFKLVLSVPFLCRFGGKAKYLSVRRPCQIIFWRIFSLESPIKS